MSTHAKLPNHTGQKLAYVVRFYAKISPLIYRRFGNYIKQSMSPGLKRAREPYRVKNAIVGLALGAFAVGVWAYSISAVKQDIFDDVDEEAEALSAGVAQASKESVAPLTGKTPSESSVPAISITPATNAAATINAVSNSTILGEVAKAQSVKGVLPRMGMPGWLLDPERKTLVWGAPPVDDLGKMGRRS